MKNSENWNKFIGNEIPSSIETQSIIYEFIKKDDKIIDIGCGFGKTVFDLCKKGYVNIYGIDSNKSGIEFANLKSKQLKLNPKPKFKVANASYMPFKKEGFDCIITQAFWTTIVTSRERLKIIKEINRILKRNGIIYIADFMRTWCLYKYKNLYRKGVEKGYEKGTFEAKNPSTGKVDYLAHHYIKNELLQFVKTGGFGRIEYYQRRNFFTRSGNKINGCVMIARKS